jgi:Glycosyl hydrolases family 18
MATASIVLSTIKSARALGERSGRALRSAANAIHPTTHKRAFVAFSVVMASVVGVVGVLDALGGSSKPAYGQVQSEGRGNSRLPSVPDAGAGVKLAPASAPPTPAPPSLANAAPLRAHEIFGFAPYWTLSQSAGFNVSALSTLAYFSVDVNADGSLDHSGAGWDGYESQALADLVSRAHGAGDRVVLTVSDFDQTSLNQLTSSPTAGSTLSTALVAAIEAKKFDGVNLDFEGEGNADQSGLTRLVTHVSAAIHNVNPHYQVTMDTYASSAGDSGGFYNISALAPAVDGFFVMAYQLNLQSSGSPSSPLTSTMLSDKTTIDQYAAAVPTAKVILGMPYFGIDWPTTNGTLTAQASGPATDVSYGQVASSGHPIYWDDATDTAWTSYQVGNQWHETFFEDPTSLYDTAQLASASNLGGLGVWALGMDGNDPSLLAALLGFAPAISDDPVGPSATSPSGPAQSGPVVSTPSSPGPTSTTSSTVPRNSTTTTTTTTTTTASTAPQNFDYTGTWQGQSVTLSPIPAAQAPPAPTGPAAGHLIGFATNDPSDSCAASEAFLQVWPMSASSNQYLVLVQEPGDCIDAEFSFKSP